jgi:hypothetical protein
LVAAAALLRKADRFATRSLIRSSFAEGDVAVVLTRDGSEARRPAEVYGPEN